MSAFRCIIMGAAGRDFHDFNTFFRSRPDLVVVAFTATQIPFISDRSYPRSLAGAGYDADIPIFPEQQLPELIRRLGADLVFFAYSDVPHVEVMHKASIVQAAGASFVLLGPRQTELAAKLPVIAVTAVRTGAGKSPLSQYIARHLVAAGRRVAVLRHPMPYGRLDQQIVERFATEADLDRHDCTIEEREEYEPYIEQGLVVFAGVDYARILGAAEAEADVVLWDGGNNDASFIRPDLSIVVADALRAGDELAYYPGETNLRMADVVVINKVGGAAPGDAERVQQNVARTNPHAVVVRSDLEIFVDKPERIRGRRALVVEDGPTLTHGGMRYGAGTLAARDAGASELVDPRPGAVGSIAATFAAYPHLGAVLPAMGYSAEQRAELERTIRASGAEVVVDASPARIDRLLDVGVPVVRVRYQFAQRTGPPLPELIDARLKELLR